jgi:glutathionyl-hydroquinone reductase
MVDGSRSRVTDRPVESDGPSLADRVMGAELASGEFKRQRSRFRDWVGFDPRNGRESDFRVEPGRYHLYVALACPWSHRVVIVRELAGLGEALGISYAAPFRDERGWAFTGERFEDGPTGSFTDDLNDWAFLSEGYLASDASFSERVTVPVLWDKHSGRIVNNESSEIMRMLHSPDSLGGLGARQPDLYPEPLREEIDRLCLRIYDTFNNGVYRAGFARRQDAYERAFHEVFEALDWLEELLAERRYLAGDRIAEVDWRLFPTVVRFDEVYHVHFRCNRRRIVEYPNLWGYTRDLYQQPGIAQTVAMDQIKRHYYTTHDELNPKRIVPLGPAPDWWAPHGRG